MVWFVGSYVASLEVSIVLKAARVVDNTFEYELVLILDEEKAPQLSATT